MKRLVVLQLILLAAACASVPAPSPRSSAEIDSFAARAMAATNAKGLAIAVVESGEVTHVGAYGVRNADGAPLTTDTVMYGASLTKTVLAFNAMQWVDRKLLDLDRPFADMLPKPLPAYGTDPDVVDAYADYGPLADDPRWRAITPRMALAHTTGFANYFFFEDDGRARIHFEPGTRYAYSGDGFILLQLALERGLGLDVGALTRANFERRAVADGWPTPRRGSSIACSPRPPFVNGC